MAKVRIFELARDLNMQSKELLEKLDEMGIEAKSHMSSLEDEAVKAIKANLLGKKMDVVEETRVKPTVIRRRKKVIRRERAIPEQPVEMEAEASPEMKEAAQETPAEEKAPKESAPRKPVLKVVKKKPEEESPEETPEAVEKEPAVVPDALDEPEEKPQVAATEAAEPSAEEAVATAAEPAEPAESAAEPEEKEPPTDASAEPHAPVAEEAVQEIPKPVKPKKRRKKEAPAKIIKLGTPVPKIEKPAAEPETAPKKKAAAEDDGAADRDKKAKKGRKKPAEPLKDKKFFKKKISFRRKAVVEGKDLYGRGGRPRKARKGAKGKTAVTGGKTMVTTAKAIKRRIKMDETIVLSELAKRMGIKAGEMIKKLMGLGVMATVNQTIDFDTAVLVSAEFEYEVERASFEEDTVLKIEQDDPEKLAFRPPVVTIMGHVDHGKTSLLDAIRKTRVTDDEAGGITQHIGAYHVTTEKGRIVFLDTPGHEAFTAMRSRGASVTDIVVLVVAADDGVMPQTVEAVNHAKAAGVPIIVAVNKIDKANADPDRIMRQLSELGLNPEDWGGDTIFVRVSAKQQEGISDLLEMILLQAEVLELKANPEKLAVGHVVEAKLDSGRGPVATVLVQEGTLNLQDSVVCGIHYGKLRALVDDMGVQVSSAGPSIPVEIVGLSGVPNAGDELIAIADEKNAKQVSLHRMQKQRSKELAQTTRVSLESLFEHMKEGETKDLNVIIKADVHGSIEALKDSLVKLSNEEVGINVVHAATGTITESDVSLASVSEAIIIGFNVRPNAKVQSLAADEHVDIRFYNVIYNVIKDIKDAIVGMMDSTYEEKTIGMAEVRQVFHVPKIGAIAGSYVTDGKIQRGQMVRLLREGVVQYEGKINSLRRFKDDAKEVMSGYECGIGIENYNDIKVGDTLECYFLEEIKPSIEA